MTMDCTISDRTKPCMHYATDQDHARDQDHYYATLVSNHNRFRPLFAPGFAPVFAGTFVPVPGFIGFSLLFSPAAVSVGMTGLCSCCA